MSAREIMIVSIVALLSATTAIVAPVAIVSHNSTERMEACLKSGGEYRMVPETSRMECRR